MEDKSAEDREKKVKRFRQAWRTYNPIQVWFM
jgi:hypothetical protein